MTKKQKQNQMAEAKHIKARRSARSRQRIQRKVVLQATEGGCGWRVELHDGRQAPIRIDGPKKIDAVSEMLWRMQDFFSKNFVVVVRAVQSRPSMGAMEKGVAPHRCVAAHSDGGQVWQRLEGGS